MFPNILIQTIGFVALTLSLIVFQINKRSDMLKIQMSSALLYAVHFYLLGAYIGAIMNFIGAIRNYSYSKVKKRTWILPTLFIFIFIVTGILTWQGWISILPIAGMISGTLAFWQNKPKYIRLLDMISSPLWFFYNFMSGFLAGMMAEILILSSDVVGIYRFDINKLK